MTEVDVTGIHPTAIIDPSATIGERVDIGPFSVIGANTKIGDGTIIGAGVGIDWTTIGPGCRVGANTVIGGDPQYDNWENTPSWVDIGANTRINELVIIHRSIYEGKSTSIGEECHIMSQTHIGHDCRFGRGVILTSLAGLSGHVEVGDWAVIGGAAVVHQFCRIGTMAMVGGMTRVVQDVAPFFTVVGNPASAHGLNSFAFKKRGIPKEERSGLKKAYKILVRSKLPLADALTKIESELPQIGAVAQLVEFIKLFKRGVTL